ncbi:hypothetical protein Q8A67_009396 [Cirrhinus molitorella]|uniref:Uncharacterized protein n=1 Tax=Cirrhinus molitorella TaxID=172907 RepID=A0AA88TT92_9TELE|nr:hypothetical protein Q8A67_009396 [Cirrhinus molitorella]
MGENKERPKQLNSIQHKVRGLVWTVMSQITSHLLLCHCLLWTGFERERLKGSCHAVLLTPLSVWLCTKVKSQQM